MNGIPKNAISTAAAAERLKLRRTSFIANAKRYYGLTRVAKIGNVAYWDKKQIEAIAKRLEASRAARAESLEVLP